MNNKTVSKKSSRNLWCDDKILWLLFSNSRSIEIWFQFNSREIMSTEKKGSTDRCSLVQKEDSLSVRPSVYMDHSQKIQSWIINIHSDYAIIIIMIMTPIIKYHSQKQKQKKNAKINKIYSLNVSYFYEILKNLRDVYDALNWWRYARHITITIIIIIMIMIITSKAAEKIPLIYIWHLNHEDRFILYV